MKYWCGSCKAAQTLVHDEERGARGEGVVVRGWCAVCGAPAGAIGVYEVPAPRSADYFQGRSA